MRPDKPGEWHSRDRRKIVVYDDGIDYMCRWADKPGLGLAFSLRYLVGDDWLPAIAPEFPELPPRPPMVLCTSEANPTPTWRTSVKYGDVRASVLTTGYFRVVPHLDNDSEAVRMIEEANKNARQ